jgi:hypothetical protein
LEKFLLESIWHVRLHHHDDHRHVVFGGEIPFCTGDFNENFRRRTRKDFNGKIKRRTLSFEEIFLSHNSAFARIHWEIIDRQDQNMCMD